MDLETLTAIVPELSSALLGRRFGKVYTVSRFQFIFDLRLHDSRYLFVSIEPASPRIYLVTRRLRDIEKQAVNTTAFAVFIQKRLAGTTIGAIAQLEGERIIFFDLYGKDDFGVDNSFSLAFQLTGRSANIFLLDHDRRILESARETRGTGQQTGDIYSKPERGVQRSTESGGSLVSPSSGSTSSLSSLLDEFYLSAASDARFAAAAGAARKKVRVSITKLERLRIKLDGDLAGHGDAEKWKRYGDLLLANASASRRENGTFIVVDYYDEGLPEVAIETAENLSITEAAEDFFRRYTKARNAYQEIARRRVEIAAQLAEQYEKLAALEKAFADGDESVINALAGKQNAALPKKGRAADPETGSFARSFTSSDGFEILVGKKAKDNDHLTFRVAKSLDLWMHAADYPGSHVVIRNPNRKEVPQNTILEAAQLAAFYSQGKAQTKAAVHYTQKKFVNKPRGAAPGLVSLASFKTILVVPRVPDLVQKTVA